MAVVGGHRAKVRVYGGMIGVKGERGGITGGLWIVSVKGGCSQGKQTVSRVVCWQQGSYDGWETSTNRWTTLRRDN